MAEHKAVVEWTLDGSQFTDNKYSRGHTWHFDAGLKVPASSAPDVVPLPLSVEAAVDPEEALVAALSSCHMLFFLAFAAKKGFVVQSYRDEVVGVMGKIDGKTAVAKITMQPHVRFGGEKKPSAEEFAALHHDAHEKCFIANSVKSEVVCEPVIDN